MGPSTLQGQCTKLSLGARAARSLTSSRRFRCALRSHPLLLNLMELPARAAEWDVDAIVEEVSQAVFGGLRVRKELNHVDLWQDEDLAKKGESLGMASNAISFQSASGVDAALGGEAMSGFEELYLKHCRRVYSICLRMMANVAEAEDLTHEVFLQLHRKLGSFRGEAAFTTWLHRLTVNQVLMYFRSALSSTNATH